MTPQQREVHLRLISVLPVRTYQKPAVSARVRKGPKWLTDAECRALKKKIRKLHAKGHKYDVIAKRVGCCIATVYNYLRKR